ncbi:MAG TPA: hypothetical protein VNU97_02810 [Rhizomicrobium sp.]|nr:hypothetical protein [Rhizomicrobium sp.]
MASLTIASEIALPGLARLPAGAYPDAVTVRRAAVPEALAGAGESHATYEIAGDSFLFRIPRLARFLLRAGRDIAFQSEGDATDGDVAAFLAGTVLGILLHQRGEIVLHASAVEVGGRAVLFCGPSGAGKSALAAALGQRGHGLLADDLCTVAVNDAGTPIVHPDGSRLALWAHSIQMLGLASDRGAAVRERLQKFHVAAPPSAKALPLGALYALRETRPPLRDGIEPPNIVDAMLLVRRAAYRPRLVFALEQRARYLQAAAAMTARAGVFFLNRPLDFAQLPAVIGGLERHWRERGLGGGRP